MKVRLKRTLRWTLLAALTIIGIAASIFFLYSNSLEEINPLTISYYNQLKTELIEQGNKDRLLVISSKRANWHNQILTMFGASSNSRHLVGDAIDIMIFDVNNDDEVDSRDVDVVYKILDTKIVRDKGGIGTYKTESIIWDRQMIHLDCRQNRTRWHR